MEQKRILRIVIASPGDVQAERDSLSGLVQELNRNVAADRGIRLELSRWETDSYPGFHPEGPQGLLDPSLKIEDCDILIGIFWSRFGTPTKTAKSGTEHELRLAYEAWKRTGRPQIMTYFNKEPPKLESTKDVRQFARVIKFKEQFPKEGLWWSYNGAAEFVELTRNHLTNFIREQFPLPPPEDDSPTSQGGNAVRGLKELTETYRAHLSERVSKVYLFGAAEARQLEKVFVELNIIEEYRRPTVHAEFLSLVDAEIRLLRNPFALRNYDYDEEDETERTGDKAKRTIKPDDLLPNRTQAVITGAPGCGKTTLLRYLAWKVLTGGERMSVFLELKTVTEDDFNKSDGDLAGLLFDRAVSGSLHLSRPERERLRKFFDARLAAGEVAIFLDGLDEVGGASFFPALCNSVKKFVGSDYRHNTLIVSTRPHALQARFEGLHEMEIAPLNQQQVEEFVRHYYGDDAATKQLLRMFRQHRALRELTHVPFLLAVIIHLYHERKQVVEDRLELYRQIVWHLVTQLDREKSVVRHDFRLRDRTGAIKLDFLKQLACERLLIDELKAREHEAARLVFTGQVILEKAKEFWARANLPEGSHYDLADDVKATPLLREIGADVYAFTHLTIQEYLAAEALSKRDDCEKYFCRAYFNPTLVEMEVLPMALGLTREPDKLYVTLEELPESLTFTGLRLRARGLAYAPEISQPLLARFTKRLLSFITAPSLAEKPYKGVILHSLSAAGSKFLEFITDQAASLLCDDSSSVPWGAVAVLQQIGTARATAVLIEALQDEDEVVRENAAFALGQIGDRQAVGPLIEALNYDEYLAVRWRAASALGHIGGERAVARLIEALWDEDSDVSDSAAYALAEMGGEQAKAGLLEAFNDEDGLVRASALQGLSVLGGEKIIDVLIESLNDDEPEVCHQALNSLSLAYDERAVEAVIEKFKDEDEIMRAGVAITLQEIGSLKAADALIKALNDDYSVVRYTAAMALGQMKVEQAVDALAKALPDRESIVRQHAAHALEKIGSERATAALRAALDAPDNRTRVWPAALLGKAGEERAVEVLVEALSDEDPAVRKDAAEALRDLKAERAVPALVKTLRDKIVGVRLQAAYTLTLTASGRTRGVAALIKMSRAASEYTRNAAVMWLGEIGDGAAVAALIAALKDEKNFVREHAAEALGKMNEDALAEGLLQALSHKDDFVRAKAAQAAGYYADGERLLDKLALVAAGDSTLEVKEAANDARARVERKLAYFR
ncbi:MAG TPA: HEAT repeat domain-containing protein [Pyrinomonadaceae bacterium]|nr:HEAT repeat domain-containing protein [Pyrinomonadaceae bacterium]